MESVLVLAHVDEGGGAPTKGSLEAVTAGMEVAAACGGQLVIGIVGQQGMSAARMFAATGARVVAVEGEGFAQARYGSDAAACEALCRAVNPTMVIAPASSRFSRVLAGVALRLGGAIDTHVTSIRCGEKIEVSRWFYRQRMEGVLVRATRPWFVSIDPGSFVPYAAEAGDLDVEALDVKLPALRTTVTGFRSPSSSANTILPEAKLLLVAGAGWTKKQPDGQTHATDAGELILQFLKRTGASLGSSKSLVDQGGNGTPVLPFLTHMNQVGQTGSTPRHQKGLSTCCHGEEPHVVGWRFIGDRRAISLDPNCGWVRGKADVVYVADAFQVIRKVNELLTPSC